MNTYISEQIVPQNNRTIMLQVCNPTKKKQNYITHLNLFFHPQSFSESNIVLLSGGENLR